MRAFKTKEFNKYARREGIDDQQLCAAIAEIENGLVEANLGGGLYKKRLASDGSGKSGGYRSLLAYKQGKRIVFIFAFAKNETENISESESKALKIFAKELLRYSDKQIEKAIKEKSLFEIKCKAG